MHLVGYTACDGRVLMGCHLAHSTCHFTLLSSHFFSLAQVYTLRQLREKFDGRDQRGVKKDVGLPESFDRFELFKAVLSAPASSGGPPHLPDRYGRARWLAEDKRQVFLCAMAVCVCVRSRARARWLKLCSRSLCNCCYPLAIICGRLCHGVMVAWMVDVWHLGSVSSLLCSVSAHYLRPPLWHAPGRWRCRNASGKCPLLCHRQSQRCLTPWVLRQLAHQCWVLHERRISHGPLRRKSLTLLLHPSRRQMCKRHSKGVWRME